MTNEEAIKELIDASHREAKYGDTNNHYYEIMKRIEAFDMAIKALETQPCEDCINRADILDAIETWDKFGVNAEQKLIRWQDHYVPYVHLDDVRNAIANMPSVTPQHTRWIPVSERLPEDRELILFSTKTDEVFEGKYFDGITNSKWYSCRDDTFVWNNVVTAWMPLPEPYKGESDKESEE